ncbi:DUF1430 domain-containing protein [Streptococcus danieliae]|uniref:DUF1430 domain-containing protein n=1 Tax=Streptococcus danieliae TaxID=747656 RepID=A0A7Z0M6F7_9STRE|nr:DUF1430 domain-containing protein [Streptococcus danieliae]MBF0699390.1 DUF1430 domain-containing protein [Streptococcus danieliae]NYS96566.1 DUF1430 domain-containing protein [Streptococcus danieliae]
MKKLFLSLSILFLSLIVAFHLGENREQLLFASYPSVDIIDRGDNRESWESFAKNLDTFAREQDSLLALRTRVPNSDGKVSFVYTTFGDGTSPDGLKLQGSGDSQDVKNAYLLLDGPLTAEHLSAYFHAQGYQSFSYESSSLWKLSFSILGTPLYLLSLALAALAYFSITVIEGIKTLRHRGLKLLSGQSYFQIFLQAFKKEAVFSAQMTVLAFLVGAVFLFLSAVREILFFQLLAFILILYIVGLLLIYLSLQLLLLLHLKYSPLVSLLKGALPFSRLLSLLLLSQCVALLALGWTEKTVSYAWNQVTELASVEQDWNQAKELVEIGYSFGAAFTKGEEQREQEESWLSFIHEAWKSNAIFVHNDLRARQFEVDRSDSIFLQVSSSYLENQKLDYPKEWDALQVGQFGLLLPENLWSQKELYLSQMKEKWGTDIQISAFPYKTSKKLFIYNTSWDLNQRISDPILEVIGPESIVDKDLARSYWSSTASQFLQVPGYQQTLQLLEKTGADRWVSSIEFSQKNYQLALVQARQEFTFLVLGACLSGFISLLLYFTTQGIYFQEFRKEIFLKRLNGLNFWEVHGVYLFLQLIVLGVAASLQIYWAIRPLFVLGNSLLYLICLLLLLYYQQLKEDQSAVLLLKGGG